VTRAPRRATLAFGDVDGIAAAIREGGGRLSAARRVVLEALFAAEGPVSAEHIADGLGGRMVRSDVSSVYRNLEHLEELGVVCHVHLGHGPGLYALESDTPRAYLVCEQCDRVDGVEAGRLDAVRARLWLQKWRWYERNSLPWNRVAIHAEFARRGAFCRWPVQGNVLEALRDGRLEIGAQALLEPGVWITAPAPARVRIGGGTFLNMGVMVAAVELVEIGAHCMLANGCFVTDGNHRFDDPDRPVPWQGFTTKGPTRLGDNVWCGANVVVTSGVTIGERCVIGANSVVTQSLPPRSIAAGAPAKVLREIDAGGAQRGR